MDEKVKNLEAQIKELQFNFDEMMNVASEQTEAYRKEHKRVKELEIQLDEAQQWIDSEPDWKQKYNENYIKLLNRVKELEDVIGYIKDSKIYKVERLFENSEDEIKRLTSHLDLAISAGREGWKRVKELEIELSSLDEIFARRESLDSEPTRYAKIVKTINTARKADWAIKRVKELEEGIEKFKHRHSKETSYYDETLTAFNRREVEAEKKLYKLIERR